MSVLKSYTSEEISNLYATGIYKIENKVNGKFYIGSACNLGKIPSTTGFYFRWYGHIKALEYGNHGNQHLQRAWDKYGSENFDFQIVHTCPPEECLQFEQLYLNFLCPHYNICLTAGNMLGYRHTEEAKQRIGSAFRGKKRSEEVKAKIAASQEVVTFTLVNPEGEVYNDKNLTAFCKKFNLNRRDLQSVIKGKFFHYKGWTTSLEANQLYIYYYQKRGVGKCGDRWLVQTKSNNKKVYNYFKSYEEAINFRNNMLDQGYEFKVKTLGWKKKLEEKLSNTQV